MAKKQENKKGILWLLGGATLLFAISRGNGSDSGSGSGSGGGGSASDRPISDALLRNAFQVAKSKYGATIAGQAEQLYRKETRNFDSGQFRKTYTPGMEQAKGKDEFPYGWGSLNDFLSQYPQYKGEFKLVQMAENTTGIQKKFVYFPTLEGAVMFVAYTINRRGNPGYWRSFDEATAQAYANSLKSYPIKYT